MAFEEKEFKWSLKSSGDFKLLREMIKKSPVFSSFGARGKIFLINDSYFDTKERFLSRRKTAFRFRKSQGRAEITLKSASVCKNGLCQRTEKTKKLNKVLRKAKAAAAVRQLFVKTYGNTSLLTEIFTIQTRRQQFSLDDGALKAQLCLDSSLIKAGKKTLRLREMELEYVKGPFENFLLLAQLISKITGLAYAQKSKVASAAGLLKK